MTPSSHPPCPEQLGGPIKNSKGAVARQQATKGVADSAGATSDNETVLRELLISQLNFGLSYIQEARVAHDEDRFAYGDLARQIALNAYSTANRFASRLAQPRDPVLLEQVARFKLELDDLLSTPVAVPSIA